MRDPYFLSSLCDGLICGRRRWFYLAGNGLALLLCLLIPGLRGLLLALMALTGCTLALYLTHRHHAFGAEYQRKPCPGDAKCETVLIDAALIGQGTRLRAASQPVDVADGLSLRLGSGTLLLGTAMVLVSQELPPQDRSALLSAVQAINLRPDRLRSHSPLVAREEAEGVSIVTVRDGMNSRRYYLGTPETLLPHCPAIWEEHTRPMTEQDPLRILDAARYMERGGCRVLAFATALESEEPIFLGLAGLGEDIHMEALKDASDLRAMGLTLMLEGSGRPEGDVDTLRALMELPDHHARADIHLTTREVAGDALGITRRSGDSLLEPIRQLRSRFSAIEKTLRRFALALGFCLALSLFSGVSALPLAVALLVTCGALFIGVDLTVPGLRWPVLAASIGLGLVTRLFLGTLDPALARPVGCLLPLMAAMCCLIRLGGKGFSLKNRDRASLIAVIAGGVMILASIVLCLLGGFKSLLPLCFVLLISGAVCALLLLCDKLFP